MAAIGGCAQFRRGWTGEPVVHSRPMCSCSHASPFGERCITPNADRRPPVSPVDVSDLTLGHEPSRRTEHTPEKKLVAHFGPKLPERPDSSASAPVGAAAAAALPAQVETPTVTADGGSGTSVARTTIETACLLLERMVGDCPDMHARNHDVYAPIFHSVSVPSISGSDYLVHHLLRLGLVKKEHLAEPIVLHAVLLIDRLLHAQSANGFHLCRSNVHRVLLSTVLISAKLLDDECYTNAYWATVGGVALCHLNALEVETMALMNYEMLVTASALEAARARLMAPRAPPL